MENSYLQSTVGPALIEALAKASVAHPEDPIEYIAHYLLKYKANQEADVKVIVVVRFRP